MPGPDGRGGHYLTFADRQLIEAAHEAYPDVAFVECQCIDDDGLMTCSAIPTWRITVLIDPAARPASWTICQQHLADAILIASSHYGVPIEITYA